MLKGNVLLDLKKLPDAMNHFREAMLVAPYRYELHKGLIDCYLAQVSFYWTQLQKLATQLAPPHDGRIDGTTLLLRGGR